VTTAAKILAEADEAPPPPIDPGEALLAVMGVHKIADGTARKFTKVQLRECMGLHKQFRLLARSLCRGALTQPVMELHPYKRLLDGVGKPITEAAANKWMDLCPKKSGMLFAHAAKTAMAFLQARLPRAVERKMYALPRNVAPPDPDWYRFLAILDVLEDPRRVFQYASSAMLLKVQVDAVRAVYPTIAAAIDHAIQEATIDAQSKKQSFELPMYAEIGVRTWIGQPLVLPALQQTYIDAAAEQQAAQKRESATQETALSKESLTGAQAALYATVGK
jgi:hypothetical protein